MKTVSIKGNLNKQPLRYSLCPPEEFSFGVWGISILSVAYSANQMNVITCCEISSNFVVSERYNAQHGIETYEQPLLSFLLDTSKVKLRIQNVGILSLQHVLH